jgi:hypothetical protein
MFARRQRAKVFCIGRNKTGTTSMASALSSLGYRVGNQRKALLLLDDWTKRKFKRIIRYCRSADAFQDMPFSIADTYRAMDLAFPGSKFILTVRDSPEEWYTSLIRSHTRIVNKGRVPTANDLKRCPIVRKGWLWYVQELIYGIDASTLYDKAIYTEHYESHNQQIIEYFKLRESTLLVLNLRDPLAMRRLCEFLGVGYVGQTMPHLNSSGPSVPVEGNPRQV